MLHTWISNNHGGVSWPGIQGRVCSESETHKKKTSDETGSPCSSSSLLLALNNSPIQVDALFMEKKVKEHWAHKAPTIWKTPALWTGYFLLTHLQSPLSPSPIELPWVYTAAHLPFLQKAPSFSTPTQSRKGTPDIVFPKALLSLFLWHPVLWTTFQICSPDFQSSL